MEKNKEESHIFIRIPENIPIGITIQDLPQLRRGIKSSDKLSKIRASGEVFEVFYLKNVSC